MHAVSLCFHKMMATALTAKTACPESLIILPSEIKNTFVLFDISSKRGVLIEDFSLTLQFTLI